MAWLIVYVIVERILEYDTMIYMYRSCGNKKERFKQEAPSCANDIISKEWNYVKQKTSAII